MNDAPTSKPKPPRRHWSYWPVAVLCGIVPSVLLLPAGVAEWKWNVYRSIWPTWDGAVDGTAASETYAPMVNAIVLGAPRRFQGPLIGVAAVLNMGLLLAGMWCWKEMLSTYVGARVRIEVQFAAYAFTVVPSLILFAFAWSRMARGPRLQITLGQILWFTTFGCVLLAAGLAIVQPLELIRYRAQLKATQRLEKLGVAVRWENGEIMSANKWGNLNENEAYALLAKVSKLRFLTLANSRITDAQFAELGDLAELEGLAIDSPNISDASLPKIAKLTKLRFLDLNDTQVTDAGLAQLAALVNLRAINLTGSPVTRTGLDGLKEQLPNCSIYCQFPNGSYYNNGRIVW